MQCEKCGILNPDEYAFCGKCGTRLGRPEPAATTGTSTPIAGPSFLGLGSDSQDDTVSYLLDDDPPRHRGGVSMLVVALMLLFAAAGYIAYWKYLFPLAPPPQHAFYQPAPGFAYDKTPPEVFNEAQISAVMHQLPDRKLVDQLALENFSADMRNTEARQKLEQARKKEPDGTDLVSAGEKYLYGRGVMTNCDEALKNFQAAADLDNAAAMSHLGTMYASGRCVKFDRVEAYRWFAQAKNLDTDNTWLEASMDMLWKNMSKKERTAILK